MSASMEDGPPRLSEALLRAAASRRRNDWVVGDLREEYAHRRARHGRLRVDLWHWGQSVRIAGRLLGARLLSRDARRAAPGTIPRGDPPTTMDSLLQDLRFGLRNLLAHPTFAAVAVVALAVGIGANTTIFSVVHGVLRDLPYPGGERISLIYEDYVGDGTGTMALAPGEVAVLRDNREIFEELVAYTYSSAILGGEPHPESVGMPLISHDFLDFLDIAPVHGRGFVESDVGSEERLLLVGHELWQRRWNGDPDLVGDEILVNDESFTVIGIAPVELDYFNDTDRVYGLLEISGADDSDFASHGIYPLARLRPGDSVDAVEARVSALVGRAQRAGGHGQGRPHDLVLYSLYEAWVGNVREPLLMLMGAVGLLVLVACSNVANLQLAHGIRRQRELAVRVSLGASRGRLVRQLLTESGLLATAAGACGLAVAWLSMAPLRGLIGSNLPRVDNIEIDGTTLLFALGLSLVAGLASGVVPGILASSRGPARTLKTGVRGVGDGGGGGRARSAFLIAQLALAVVLAVGAALLASSFRHVQNVDLGIDPRGVMASILQFHGRPAEYPDPGAAVPVMEEIQERVRAFPETRAVGMVNMLPGTGNNMQGRFLVEDAAAEPEEPFVAGSRVVTPGYFETVGLSVLRGRALAEGDGAEGTPPVAIVDRRFAELNWPDAKAVGERIRVAPFRQGDEPGPWMRVVGVVEATRLTPYAEDTEPIVYVPLRQRPYPFMTLVARMDPVPGDLAGRLRSTVAEIDPGQPVSEPRPLPEVLSATMARQRLNTVLMGCLAGLALLLAAVGEYAVLQHHAAQRTREIGIRLALGARAGNVVGMVVGQGVLLGITGIGVGLAGAWFGSRFLESMLHGIEPHDPGTYAVVAGALLGVALLASLMPARRAARTDPMQALRSE